MIVRLRKLTSSSSFVLTFTQEKENHRRNRSQDPRKPVCNSQLGELRDSWKSGSSRLASAPERRSTSPPCSNTSPRKSCNSPETRREITKSQESYRDIFNSRLGTTKSCPNCWAQSRSRPAASYRTFTPCCYRRNRRSKYVLARWSSSILIEITV